jgi:hypothetical protein
VLHGRWRPSSLIVRMSTRREPRTLSHGNALLWMLGRSGRGSPAMTAIPLHIQRRIEQRWASRFARPVASDAQKNIGAKATPSTVRRPVELTVGTGRIRSLAFLKQTTNEKPGSKAGRIASIS